MSNLFASCASGLAVSAAKFSTAAGKVASGSSGGPAPEVPQPQPASASPPGAAPVAGPLAGSSAVNAQQGDTTSWMVEILRARDAYRANLETMKVADKMAKSTVDLIG